MAASNFLETGDWGQSSETLTLTVFASPILKTLVCSSSFDVSFEKAVVFEPSGRLDDSLFAFVTSSSGILYFGEDMSFWAIYKGGDTTSPESWLIRRIRLVGVTSMTHVLLAQLSRMISFS